MRAKIAKWGNSLGVRLPRTLADEVGLKEGQFVEILARDGSIEMRPLSQVPRYRLDQLLDEAERLGPENRPAFEDWGILPSEWPDDDWRDLAPNDEEMGIENGAEPRSAGRGR